MTTTHDPLQDVMQVCRNGHVITDLLRTFPERGLTHCDRCGVDTIDRCPTCGQELPGAFVVAGLQPVGLRQRPQYCAACGVAFPWTKQAAPSGQGALAGLESFLDRLPLVIRQLRVRHGERPPFRVEDTWDLEDLLRALLPLWFEDIRPQCRTPRYAATTRTDFRLAAEQIVVLAKLAREPRLGDQLREDGAYYGEQGGCRTLVAYIHDPEGMLRETPFVPGSGGRLDEGPEVRCVIGAGHRGQAPVQ